MTQSVWSDVDDYISRHLVPSDPALDAALAASDAAGLPQINVTPTQGKLLMLMAQSMGARRILEIGTLGGYSTIWLARALPAGGSLITLELDPKHADVARQNIARAGLEGVVETRVGRALDGLAALVNEAHPPFDFVFIDADKVSTLDYFEWALKLTRRGSVIVVDNVVRQGNVIDANTTDASVQGIRRFFDAVAHDPRVNVTAIQTVGSKGYDGLALALVV